MLTELGQTCFSFLYLLLGFVDQRLLSTIWFVCRRVLRQDSLAAATNCLLTALASCWITLLHRWAGIILLTKRHLGAVDSILAIEDIGAVHVDWSGIYCPNHVIFNLRIERGHRQTVRQILSVIHFFAVVLINFLLDLVDLSLDVTKRPLLGLLHLDHHLLNLLELLETVCLHLFQLFLLLNQHIQACFLIISKKCVGD
jgi:hypothetical protein